MVVKNLLVYNNSIETKTGPKEVDHLGQTSDNSLIYSFLQTPYLTTAE